MLGGAGCDRGLSGNDRAGSDGTGEKQAERPNKAKAKPTSGRLRLVIVNQKGESACVSRAHVGVEALIVREGDLRVALTAARQAEQR